MSRMIKKLSILIVITVFALGVSHHSAEANAKYASIIMDADTGMILEQQRADKRLHPASLTKIMTLLLLFESIESGRMSYNSRIPMSRHAASMVPSKLNIPAGGSIKAKDAIYSLVTKSANDVAVAIAERLGGSEAGFARLMNQKAKQIGMTRTHFRNASGLHDPRQISTARDMAKLARYVIQSYPRYYKFFSTQNFSYAGKNYHNHNRLLGKYEGMDGMKTGYVAASGFNLVASAVRNDRRIIAVVFGGRSSRSRNSHMEVLLDRGFSKLGEVRIARAKVPVPPRKPAVLNAFAALGKIGAKKGQQLAAMNTDISAGFREFIGQGDFDPGQARRVETGLMAMAAHKNNHVDASGAVRKTSYAKPVRRSGGSSARSLPWSVQIGAYRSRVATDKVIHSTLKSLPRNYAAAQPVVAPLKTDSGWLYRARLTGFTKEEAYGACRYIKDCLPVAPRN